MGSLKVVSNFRRESSPFLLMLGGDCPYILIHVMRVGRGWVANVCCSCGRPFGFICQTIAGSGVRGGGGNGDTVYRSVMIIVRNA